MILAQETFHQTDGGGGLRVKTFADVMDVEDGSGEDFLVGLAHLVGGLDDIARADERGNDGGGVITSGLQLGGVGFQGVAHFADVTFLQRIIQVGHITPFIIVVV